jgi:thiosulfate/3-mercaptopyruvate sulfurtransferase
MKSAFTTVRTCALQMLLLSAMFAAFTLGHAQTTAKPAATADDIPAASQIQPESLARFMQEANAPNPLILYVGPKAFYVQSHIAGAEFIGPTGKPEGMTKLRNRMATIKKDKPVVIYCGCCPWDHCPNIRPAFAELNKAGFTNVRVLYLKTSFGADWKDKGLPVASGE